MQTFLIAAGVLLIAWGAMMLITSASREQTRIQQVIDQFWKQCSRR